MKKEQPRKTLKDRQRSLQHKYLAMVFNEHKDRYVKAERSKQ